MLGNLARRRALWIIGLLATIVLASSAATAADHTTDVIHIDIDGRSATLTYGDTVQSLSTPHTPCRVPDEQLDGPVLDLSASSFTWNGHPVSGYVGIKNSTLGVNRTGQGSSHWCKKIDYLGHGRTESLDISLADAPASDGKVISSATLNLKVWHYAKVKIEFFSEGQKVGEQVTSLHAGYRTINANPGVFFDHLRLSSKKGSFGLRSSSLHLEGTLASVEIDARTNATDNPTLEARDDGDITPDDVLWTYLITNTGDQDLVSFTLSDPAVEGAIGGAISCDATSIASGDSVTCSAMGTAEPGQFTNTATVDAVGEFGDEVSASDGSGYFGSLPGVSVVKATNGSQAFINIPAGDPITWTYEVTNTGNGALSDIAVSDDRLGEGAVSCPHSSLAAGASMTCSASGVAETSAEGVNYVNVGTVTASPLVGPQITDSDDASYFGFVAQFDDVDVTVDPDEELVVAGDPLTFTITIRNVGNTPIENVRVIEVINGEEQESPVCLFTVIAPFNGEGGEEICEYNTNAGEGQEVRVFRVIGSDPNENNTDPEDSAPIPVFGGLGCEETQNSGGPGLDDNPFAGFFNGSNKNAEIVDDCAAAVSVTTDTEDEGGVQVVNVVPAGGLSFNGATGLLTVYWDAAPRDLLPIARTKQVPLNPDGTPTGAPATVIPWCNDIVGITDSPDGDGNFGLQPADAVYSSATDGGDICLVRQSTEVVDFFGVFATQTTEVFYIYNDPRLIR
ncbi:MAG: hypothetical protein QNJ71_07445 [Acidimicrobiia bacterium]|nr:hypothetical protein [Acidimicrobiia bacterium]